MALNTHAGETDTPYTSARQSPVVRKRGGFDAGCEMKRSIHSRKTTFIDDLFRDIVAKPYRINNLERSVRRNSGDEFINLGL